MASWICNTVGEVNFCQVWDQTWV